MKVFSYTRLATLLLVVAVFALALFIWGCSQKSVDPTDMTKNVPSLGNQPGDTTNSNLSVIQWIPGKNLSSREIALLDQANENPTDTMVADNRKFEQPTATSIGSYMYVRFPFGFGEEGKWRGTDGTRTGGGTISSCGTTLNSHTGADYYARDLSRSDGTNSSGKPIYAGFDGWVVRAGDDGGYGKSVVIWDPNRSVCIRYAHLSYVAVGKGWWISTNTYVGNVGNTPGGFTPHLHIVGYEHVPVSNNAPIIPYICKSNYYACILYFWYYA